jgi:hypothetical protein
MSTPRKPVLLVIRDGWGKNPDASQNATNAVAMAKKPCDDRLQDAGNIADSILDPDPAASSSRAGEHLRHCIEIAG